MAGQRRIINMPDGPWEVFREADGKWRIENLRTWESFGGFSNEEKAIEFVVMDPIRHLTIKKPTNKERTMPEVSKVLQAALDVAAALVGVNLIQHRTGGGDERWVAWSHRDKDIVVLTSESILVSSDAMFDRQVELALRGAAQVNGLEYATQHLHRGER